MTVGVDVQVPRHQRMLPLAVRGPLPPLPSFGLVAEHDPWRCQRDDGYCCHFGLLGLVSNSRFVWDQI
jgi:hypothetical protein